MTLGAEPARGLGLQGHYANVASRFAAFVVDVVTVTTVFAIGSAVSERILSLLLGRTVTLSDARVVYDLVLLAWVFIYCAYPLAVTGRTFGMAVFGLRAVRADGADLGGRRAVVRVIAFPLSFLLLGLGFVLILLRRDHRALHDLLAGAAVVYGWDARAAHLRFLIREGAGGDEPRAVAG